MWSVARDIILLRDTPASGDARGHGPKVSRGEWKLEEAERPVQAEETGYVQLSLRSRSGDANIAIEVYNTAAKVPVDERG